LLRKNKMDGIGWFAFNTLQYIVKQNPQIEFHFLFDSGIDREFLFADNIVPHQLFPPAKHAVLNVIWFEWSVKRQLEKIKPDLFFSPDGILCLGWEGKQYGVIHDINFLHNPGDLKLSNRKYYNYFFPRYAKKAARLGTVSEFSRQDIQENFGIEKEKIDVVYCGINSFYHPVDAIVASQTRDKYANGNPYFVFVGTLSPRKNVLGLLKAFELFKAETGSSLRLVIVGHDMYKADVLYNQKAQMRFGTDVLFTGRLLDEELQNVMASALALVFVPFFEGFGIPLVEAMQCDVPVIASNITSVPEVAGDAALLVDPHNTEEIKNAMKEVASNEKLRWELIQKGRVRRAFFSWQKTADLVWTGIKKCL
ncbi:MAG: glycosyltransferase family 4 protein, partial [Flavisolibacter sp.]